MSQRSHSLTFVQRSRFVPLITYPVRQKHFPSLVESELGTQPCAHLALLQGLSKDKSLKVETPLLLYNDAYEMTPIRICQNLHPYHNPKIHQIHLYNPAPDCTPLQLQRIGFHFDTEIFQAPTYSWRYLYLLFHSLYL